jgi:hypothetical protein
MLHRFWGARSRRLTGPLSERIAWRNILFYGEDAMLRMTLLTILSLAFLTHPVAADTLVPCAKQVFADCTRAPCTLTANGEASCKCRIRDKPSVSVDNCTAPQGDDLQSRYYPIHAYQICPNTKTWANCLGSPCTKNSDGTASCTCSTMPTNQFIIALPTDQCSMARCNDHSIYSSATATEAGDMTKYVGGLPPKDFPDFHPPKICPAQ